jgi:hypothetical protein
LSFLHAVSIQFRVCADASVCACFVVSAIRRKLCALDVYVHTLRTVAVLLSAFVRCADAVPTLCARTVRFMPECYRGTFSGERDERDKRVTLTTLVTQAFFFLMDPPSGYREVSNFENAVIENHSLIFPALAVDGMSAHDFYHHAAIPALATVCLSEIHEILKNTLGKQNAWKVFAEAAKPFRSREQRGSPARVSNLDIPAKNDLRRSRKFPRRATLYARERK